MSAPDRTLSQDPIAIFVIALVGLLTCQFLGPWAWWMANRYLAAAEARGEPPDAFVAAARWLGIGGTTILVLASVIFVLSGVSILVLMPD